MTLDRRVRKLTFFSICLGLPEDERRSRASLNANHHIGQVSFQQQLTSHKTAAHAHALQQATAETQQVFFGDLVRPVAGFNLAYFGFVLLGLGMFVYSSSYLTSYRISNMITSRNFFPQKLFLSHIPYVLSCLTVLISDFCLEEVCCLRACESI
jgi:hypothetical protein